MVRAHQDRIYIDKRWAVLGCFFSRTVNSCVGKLLIKRGIHVGLEEQEWFRDTGSLPPASLGWGGAVTAILNNTSFLSFFLPRQMSGGCYSVLSLSALFDSFLLQVRLLALTLSFPWFLLLKVSHWSVLYPASAMAPSSGCFSSSPPPTVDLIHISGLITN